MPGCATISSPAVPVRVRHGDIRVAEHRYIIDVLLREHLGLEYQAEVVPGLDRVEIDCGSGAATRRLQVGANLLLRSGEEWLTAASMPGLPLQAFDPGTVLPDWNLGPLPVLYPAAASPPTRLGRPSTVLPFDLFGGAFFLLTRYEEVIEKQRDKHDRFLSSHSVAPTAGILLRPVVDEYGLLLGRCLEACFPQIKCRRLAPRMRLSHDIDHPFQFFGKSLPQMLISAAKRLYRHPSAGVAWSVFRAAARSWLRGEIAADPFNCYSDLMAASEALGSPGEFYFMTAATNRRYDEWYDLSRPELQEILRNIRTRGHVIGLHGSYASFRSEAALGRELKELFRNTERAGIQLQAVGGRQHYLRWDQPRTWRCWSNSGMAYDATLGFADRVGFRCGTAKEFPVFDLVESRPLGLRERPLIAMDATMTDYMHLSSAGIVTALEQLWGAVRRVGGSLEVLIHNCNPMATWLAKRLVELNARTLSATN